jgi:DNA invertase Pin-like site-specific DNA recombinase
LYARVSTKDKDQDPSTQLIPLRDWALRQGLDVEEFSDVATGRHQVRPGFQNMLSLVRQGRFDAVAVTRLDRAGRSVRDIHNFIDELDGRGIRFTCIQQPIDTSTAVGRFTVTMLAAVSELELEIISESVKEGLDRARREGKRLGRPRVRLSAKRAAALVKEHGSIAAASRAIGVAQGTIRSRLARNPGMSAN